jgi:hypothetical protein
VPNVTSACKACYVHKKPCNFFVRDVAKIVGVPLPGGGNADALIEAASHHWISLTEHQAIAAVARGEFVIAGMTSSELKQSEGHVAVVIPGIIGGFPRVASTNEGDSHWGKSSGNTPLTEVFPAKDVRANKIKYYTAPSRGTSGYW